jgi:1-acyl-sn-glycerol-3-phosphate acyltransferase
MLVANHVSWIDIFAINAIAPSCFVAKADIAAWPLIGTLVGRVGTLFLERGRRHAVHDALHKVAALLVRVAGWCSPRARPASGIGCCPSMATVVQAAVQAGVRSTRSVCATRHGRGVPGGPDGAMHFVGDISFVASLMRILGAPGVIAELHVRQITTVAADRALPGMPAGNRGATQVAGRHASASAERWICRSRTRYLMSCAISRAARR